MNDYILNKSHTKNACHTIHSKKTNLDKMNSLTKTTLFYLLKKPLKKYTNNNEKQIENTNVLFHDFFHEVLSLHEDHMFAVRKPLHVLYPRVVIPLPAPQATIAVKALHFVTHPYRNSKKIKKPQNYKFILFSFSTTQSFIFSHGDCRIQQNMKIMFLKYLSTALISIETKKNL